MFKWSLGSSLLVRADIRALKVPLNELSGLTLKFDNGIASFTRAQFETAKSYELIPTNFDVGKAIFLNFSKTSSIKGQYAKKFVQGKETLANVKRIKIEQ